ncbi:hypothetical protein ABK040_005831 [Willaertia magna]
MQDIELQDVNKFKDSLPEADKVKVTKSKPICSPLKCFLISSIILVSIIIILVFIVIIVFFAAGAYTYDSVFLSDRAHTTCPRFYTQSNPITGFTTSYVNCKNYSNVNFNEWNLPPSTSVETINFMSRDSKWIERGGGNITATLILQNNVTVDQNSKFVILIHGIRTCRRKYEVLAPAMMLWWAGYNTLLLDLRNCGDSDVDTRNPIASFGYKEHLDVFGALDYLINRFNYLNNTNNFHLFGASMGGATALISFALEPKFKSLYVDSAACNVKRTVLSNVQSVVGAAMAEFMWGGMQAMALTRSDYGFMPFPLDPLNLVSTTNLTNRPMFFEQAIGDLTVPRFNFDDCVAAAKQSGALIDTYLIDLIPPGQTPASGCNSHVETILYDKKSYEKRLTSFFNKYS